MLASMQGDGDVTLGRREEETEAWGLLPVVSTSSGHPQVSRPLPSYTRLVCHCCPGGACRLSQVCISAFYCVWCRRVRTPFHPTFGWRILLVCLPVFGEGPGSSDPQGPLPGQSSYRSSWELSIAPHQHPGRLVITLPL